MNQTQKIKTSFYRQKDKRWVLIWSLGIAGVGIWDALFLNKPALHRVASGFFNTLGIAVSVICITVALGWVTTIALHALERRKNRAGYLLVTFALNLIKSIPQIVGILFGYIFIAMMIDKGILHGTLLIFTLMAFSMSLFIFPELVDLMRERIEHYKKLDFYNAMLVCGIAENRIINFDILWKNSRIHILNKLIAIFGSAVFLQCSVDFIISVGLSTNISAVNLPTTLGSLLAKIDSKQDILAIGYTLTHPDYFPNLFLGHLQGMTVAFLIVFTLMSVFHISNGYAERHHL